MEIKEIYRNEKDELNVVGAITHEELENNDIGLFRESILVNTKSLDIPINIVARGKKQITKYIKLPREYNSELNPEVRYFGKIVKDSNGREYFIMELGEE